VVSPLAIEKMMERITKLCHGCSTGVHCSGATVTHLHASAAEHALDSFGDGIS
jgi:hypothetical protein